MDMWMVKRETNGFPNPDSNDEGGCHVQERLLLPLTQIQRHISFPNFPPPFLASTSLFLRKLEEDNICLLM
jgi:hypothetical protein